MAVLGPWPDHSRTRSQFSLGHRNRKHLHSHSWPWKSFGFSVLDLCLSVDGSWESKLQMIEPVWGVKDSHILDKLLPGVSSCGYWVCWSKLACGVEFFLCHPGRVCLPSVCTSLEPVFSTGSHFPPFQKTLVCWGCFLLGPSLLHPKEVGGDFGILLSERWYTLIYFICLQKTIH